MRIGNPEFRIQNPGTRIRGVNWEAIEARALGPWLVRDSRPMDRPKARSFEDLIVWRKAHAWVLGVYRLSDAFPAREQYALTSQLRRAAMSVPANVAEGFKKRGVRDKLRYYNIAQGSLEESRYFLILARDLGYGDVGSALSQLEEVSRLLDAYYNAILDSGS